MPCLLWSLPAGRGIRGGADKASRESGAVVNTWWLYAIIAISSFVIFLHSGKKSVQERGYNPVYVAVACFGMALLWPLSWIFVLAIGYLGDKS
jgi:hypothetical protein